MLCPPSLNTQAKSKKKSLNLLTAKSDSTKTDYAKVTKGGKKDTGLFTVIYNSKSGWMKILVISSSEHLRSSDEECGISFVWRTNK